MRLSRLWRSDATNDIQQLLDKWKKISTASSFTNHPADDILNLLKETTQMTASSSPSSAKVTQFPTPSVPAQVLLGELKNSVLIWRALRRGRIPWEATSALMPVQLAVLSAYQRAYVEQRSERRPWGFSRAVLDSWRMADPDLRDVLERLRRCHTVVGFAQEVSAALRGRPHLRQVLPVPPNVLQQLYQLGMQSPSISRECHPMDTRSSAPNNALLALNLCKQLALSTPELHSTAVRERLVMDYAHLHAHSGEWDQALSIVRSSSVVRLSTKVSFVKHARDRSLWARVDLTAREAPEAVIAAPHWRQALEVLNRFADNDDVRLDFLSRSDVIAGLSESPSWSECLSIFSKITPDKQTYGALRKSILDRLPRKNPEFIVQMAHALAHVGPRMYSGTFARRLEMLKKKCSWAEAIALACGAKCYDLASALTPHLLIPNIYKLPADLITYEKDVLTLLQMRSGGKITSPACDTITSPSQPEVDVNQLTYPQLLARALYGDWRGILHSPVALSNSRLRSLLAAKRISEDKLNDVGEVECHLFENADVTQLVLSCASGKNLQYFLRVIPSAMDAALRKKCASLSRDAKVVSPSDAYKNFLSSSTKVVTTEDCHAFCDLVVNHIRTQASQGSCSRETLLLRELARCCAQGRVQLASSDTFGLALAFLRACRNLKCRPESTTASKAFTMIPSPKLDINLPAMIVGVNALNLLGKCQTVANVYTRWRRKQCERVLPDPPSRQHVETHQMPDMREQLADVFARMVYYTPYHQQIGWARRIWRDQRNKFSILLQELLVGDTREVSRILQETSTLLSRGEKDHLNTERRLSIHAKEVLILEKRKLLGASFCILHTESALHNVVRACGKKRAEPGDIDEHGFQRLIKVLPGQDAAEAILCLHEENSETVEDHWLVSIMASPHVSAEQLGRLRAARPYSAVVSSAFKVASGLLENNPTGVLKGLLRLVIISENSILQHFLYAALAKFMQHMCENAELECVFKAATNVGENQKLAREIYNRLFGSASLVRTLKHDRNSLTMLLKNPETLSPLLLMGYLHHVLNRSLKYPIKASFSFHMLRMTSTNTHDWMTAIYFFKCIRSPRMEERCLVVWASQGSPDATRYLVGCRRFLQGCPEQVVVWCDEKLNPSEKWQVSLRLFEAVAARSVSGEEPPMKSAEETTCSSEKVDHGEAKPTHPDASERILQDLISKWTDIDCVRALELLRRTGFVRCQSKGKGGDTKPGPPPSEYYEEVSDNGNELLVVRMIRAQQQRCLMS
ncbi:unnamed protein product [Phytomonas sp. Hart1]|nr:unnamed protein product [Phytomonas sp. Hart1]|eukprot:CCW66437.1 unnamed protein product [Phytomonas sp. isolate Hart1]